MPDPEKGGFPGSCSYALKPGNAYCGNVCCAAPTNGVAVCDSMQKCAVQCNATFIDCGGQCLRGNCCADADCPDQAQACRKTDGRCANHLCVYDPDDSLPCDDGNRCYHHCSAGSCVADTVQCAPVDCKVMQCNPSTGGCVVQSNQTGVSCGGNGCFAAGTCASGTCSGAALLDCSQNVPTCHVGVCSEGACTTHPVDVAIPCDSPCVVGGMCLGGNCVGSAKVCDAGPCESASCNLTTGACETAPLDVGTPCGSGDSCRFGGECDADGRCVENLRPDGMDCRLADGNDCGTSTGQCQGGVCGCASTEPGASPSPSPSLAANCSATPGQHAPSATAIVALLLLVLLSITAAARGTRARRLLQRAIITALALLPALAFSAKTAGGGEDILPQQPSTGIGNETTLCTRKGQCCKTSDCTARDCRTLVGCINEQCVYDPRPDHSACTSNPNLCTNECNQGLCVALNRAPCFPSDECVDSACDPATGSCVETNRPDGMTCGNNGCYVGGPQTCAAGRCGTLSPRDCSGGLAACKAGACDPSNGQCVANDAPQGTSCDDACLLPGSTCNAGECSGAPKCVPRSTCVEVTCSNGTCNETILPSGTACTSPNACQTQGTCDSSGNCVTRARADGVGCRLESGHPCGEGVIAGMCAGGDCGCGIPTKVDVDGEIVPTSLTSGCAVAGTQDDSGAFGLGALALAFAALARVAAMRLRRRYSVAKR